MAILGYKTRRKKWQEARGKAMAYYAKEAPQKRAGSSAENGEPQR